MILPSPRPHVTPVAPPLPPLPPKICSFSCFWSISCCGLPALAANPGYQYFITQVISHGEVLFLCVCVSCVSLRPSPTPRGIVPLALLVCARQDKLRRLSVMSAAISNQSAALQASQAAKQQQASGFTQGGHSAERDDRRMTSDASSSGGGGGGSGVGGGGGMSSLASFLEFQRSLSERCAKSFLGSGRTLLIVFFFYVSSTEDFNFRWWTIIDLGRDSRDACGACGWKGKKGGVVVKPCF